MSQSVAAFVGKLDKAPETLKRSQSTAVRQAATAAKTVFEHAPGKPSKVAGKAVSVSQRMLGDDRAITRYTGPAHLVNNPTKAHDILPRSFVGTRGTGKRAQKGAALLAAFGLNARSGGALVLKDGNLRAVVHHPGTKGKQFFQHALPAARHAASKAYTSETHQALRKVFGG